MSRAIFEKYGIIQAVATKICLFPPQTGRGGPASFQSRLASGLEKRGIQVVNDPNASDLSAMLLVGGSRSLFKIWQARRRGVRIVQRLNGMNWIHRRRQTGLRHFLRAEYSNYLLALIRRYLAHAMVYQSHFSRNWWKDVRGADQIPTHVIYNAVDLSTYAPLSEEQPPDDRWRLLIVEGNLGGGYDWGLEAAVGLANQLAAKPDASDKPLELIVAGGSTRSIEQFWQSRCTVPIYFAGWLQRHEIPALDRSAHLLYSADVHPACPNSVIEALACGLPVLAFDTGALSELVTPDSGRVVPYGGNAWKLEPPLISNLVQGAREILNNQSHLRAGARRRAEEAFGLDQMVDSYLAVLQG